MTTMRLIVFVCHLGLVLRVNAQIPPECVASETNRAPENSDMTVSCGTTHMEVSIYICPVYNALYNESLMVLNNRINTPACYGVPDWSVTPPILTFRFPINGTSTSDCKNLITVTNQVGTGSFSDFSNIEFFNISGTINSVDPSAGQITYREQVMYKYSCRYPMQYLLNNTELAVSGVNLAIRDNNGSFITTLSMSLYQDDTHTTPLDIPQNGLDLKTKIYVAVQAKNLTERFYVLLDRCYATTAPDPSERGYDLFVGCPSDPQTVIEQNGDAQVAYFSFEAFRFVEHKNLTVSTFFLHCTTRLCEVSKCNSLKPTCTTQAPVRRRRDAPYDESANTTISSGPIYVGRQTIGDLLPLMEEPQTFSATHAEASEETSYSGPVVAIIICLAIIAIFITGLAVFLGMFIKQKKSGFS